MCLCMHSSTNALQKHFTEIYSKIKAPYSTELDKQIEARRRVILTKIDELSEALETKLVNGGEK